MFEHTNELAQTRVDKRTEKSWPVFDDSVSAGLTTDHSSLWWKPSCCEFGQREATSLGHVSCSSIRKKTLYKGIRMLDKYQTNTLQCCTSFFYFDFLQNTNLQSKNVESKICKVKFTKYNLQSKICNINN